MTQLKTTRFATGCYRVTYRGRFFEARSADYHSEGMSVERTWLVLERDADFGPMDNGSDGYWNHFATLADCKAAVKDGCDEDANT